MRYPLVVLGDAITESHSALANVVDRSAILLAAKEATASAVWCRRHLPIAAGETDPEPATGIELLRHLAESLLLTALDDTEHAFTLEELATLFPELPQWLATDWERQKDALEQELAAIELDVQAEVGHEDATVFMSSAI